MVSGLPLHAYDSENRATLRPSLNFATPFSQNSSSVSLAFPRPKNWWIAVDECRSIFQIDSVNHGSTLPLETSDRMVSGLPLHAYDSENRATLRHSPNFAFPRPKNWWPAVDECRSVFQIDGVNHGNTLPLEASDRMVSGLPVHAYDSENRATLPSFATPFAPNSFPASFAFPRPKNWWRAVDERRSIFQIDSVSHGSTLP